MVCLESCSANVSTACSFGSSGQVTANTHIDMLTNRHVRAVQSRLYDILPNRLTAKLSCLALEEKRIGEVSLDATLCADFLSSYKRKLKDNFLAIEFKVRVLIV